MIRQVRCTHACRHRVLTTVPPLHAVPKAKPRAGRQCRQGRLIDRVWRGVASDALRPRTPARAPNVRTHP
jgi:hypothetical protein